MAKTKYKAVKDGEWIRPKRRGWKMACCDCGLVHTVNFRIKNGRIEMQAYRHGLATGGKRRHILGKKV